MKRNKPKRSSNSLTFPILAVDPSFRAFGWVVVDKNIVIDFGCVQTKPTDKKLRIRKGDDRIRRSLEINNILKQIITKYNISYIVSELPHGSQSAIAANLLGMVTDKIQTISDFLEIPVEWYSEADAKRAVVYKNTATKAEMITAISRLYSIKFTGIQYKDEAIADALAIHYVASKNSHVIKTLSK